MRRLAACCPRSALVVLAAVILSAADAALARNAAKGESIFHAWRSSKRNQNASQLSSRSPPRVVSGHDKMPNGISQNAACFKLSNCSGHGECTEAGECKCSEDYLGPDCSIAACSNGCPGRGITRVSPPAQPWIPPRMFVSGPPHINVQTASARVAVVVAGQLGRLELRTKALNLVLPNQQRNVSTVLFLALQDKGANTTLRSDSASSVLPPLPCGANFALVKQLGTSPCTVFRTRTRYGHKRVEQIETSQYSCADGQITVIGGCHAIFQCDEPQREVECGANATDGVEMCHCRGAAAAAARAGYPDRSCSAHAFSASEALAELKRWAIPHVAIFSRQSPWIHVPEPIKQWVRPFRHISHNITALANSFGAVFEIYSNFRSAALAIEQYEVRYRFHFEQIVLLRDDIVVVQPYLYPFMGKRPSQGVKGRAEPYGPCVVKSCGSFSAIPDKAMMCPRAYLQPMLRGFLDDMHLHEDNGLFCGFWLEKLRERTLASFGVSVMKVDPDEMPLVVARPPCFCQAKVRGRNSPWCLRTRKSDCAPPLDPAAVGKLYIPRIYEPEDFPTFKGLKEWREARMNQTLPSVNAQDSLLMTARRGPRTWLERASRVANYKLVANVDWRPRVGRPMSNRQVFPDPRGHVKPRLSFSMRSDERRA